MHTHRNPLCVDDSCPNVSAFTSLFFPDHFRNGFVAELAKVNEANRQATSETDDIDADEDAQRAARIPVQVVSLIDQRLNPDSFTAETVLSTVDHYKVTRQKLRTLERMRTKLLEKAAVLFPEEHAAYVSLRQISDDEQT